MSSSRWSGSVPACLPSAKVEGAGGVRGEWRWPRSAVFEARASRHRSEAAWDVLGAGRVVAVAPGTRSATLVVTGRVEENARQPLATVPSRRASSRTRTDGEVISLGCSTAACQTRSAKLSVRRFVLEEQRAAVGDVVGAVRVRRTAPGRCSRGCRCWSRRGTARCSLLAKIVAGRVRLQRAGADRNVRRRSCSSSSASTPLARLESLVRVQNSALKPLGDRRRRRVRSAHRHALAVAAADAFAAAPERARDCRRRRVRLDAVVAAARLSSWSCSRTARRRARDCRRRLALARSAQRARDCRRRSRPPRSAAPPPRRSSSPVVFANSRSRPLARLSLRLVVVARRRARQSLFAVVSREQRIETAPARLFRRRSCPCAVPQRARHCCCRSCSPPARRADRDVFRCPRRACS